MMKSKYTCCMTCFDKIAKEDTNSVRIWLDMCRIAHEISPLFKIRIEDFEELRVLELLGFLTSTEVQDGIIVRVHGNQRYPYGSHFCIGDCDEKS